MKKRCEWVTDDQHYIDYHDKEWGVPLYDDIALFEMLILEGAQAGLSWITILKRREAYRKAYDGFDPQKMANWSEAKLEALSNDSTIIRNKRKIAAAKQNAQCYLQIVKELGSFSKFIWSFVGNKPLVNKFKTLAEIPITTKESEAMSKSLKKRGFSFVGPTICYAFMQAVGMVNDHTVDCFRYSELVNQ